jgi:hypothetical protein
MPTTDAGRAARDRKQKMFVVIGGLVLLLLMAIQLPRLLGGSTSTAPASETTVENPSSADDPGSIQTPISLPDGTPTASKLRSFTVFSKKDPFVQQVETDPVTGTGTTGGAAGGSTGTPGEAGQPKSEPVPSQGFTVGGTPSAAVTVISVNGGRQALVPGTAFPSRDPVFVLVAEQPEAKSVVIAVAGGAYANGAKTTKLRVGRALVLVNTATGAKYRLKLVAVGNGSGLVGAEATKAPGTTATQP